MALADTPSPSGPISRRVLRALRRQCDFWRSWALPGQFLLTAGITLVFFSFIDQLLQTRTIERALRESSAETASLYISNIVAPIVQESAEKHHRVSDYRARLDKVIAEAGLIQALERIKIWSLDGTIIYSTVPALVGRKFAIKELERASRGEIVVAVSDPTRTMDGLGASSHKAMVEIHVPIRDANGRVIAVGEVHKDTSALQERQSQVVSGMWLIRSLSLALGTATLFILVSRAHQMIVGQRQQLHRQFVEATRLAEQNDDLRTAADQLRRSAAKVNEELLSRVGAEIHDGPIQLLSVAMLGVGTRATESKVGKPDSHGPPCAAKLVGDVIQQLRTISTGLILPELEELLPSDVLLLAVTQHEKMYGTDVETYVDELPEVSQGLKACMFRIVQECLNNSQRYADGKALKVEAHHDSSSIRLIVSDRGPGLRHFPEADDRPRLGLLGARNRVEAFGGNIDVSETPGGGLVVKVTLPVDLDEGDLAMTRA